MENRDYTVTIVAATRELTAKERVAAKMNRNAVRLDEAVDPDKPLRFKPNYCVILDIHNEKSEDKDYRQYLFVDRDNNSYLTGSQNFYETYCTICDEMETSGEEYFVEVVKVPSKNYKGKYFLSCGIA